MAPFVCGAASGASATAWASLAYSFLERPDSISSWPTTTSVFQGRLGHCQVSPIHLMGGSPYTRLVLRDWPREWPPERIAAVAQRGQAAYLDASEPVRLAVFEGSEPIQPRTIIEVGGLYLAEAVDEPGDWYMGQRRTDGVIECWGRYGDIETALRGL